MFNVETNKYEGYIYAIRNFMNDKRYIGQTTRSIKDRVYEHKQTSASRPTNSIFLYQDVRNCGWDIFDVYEIEKIECDTKDELKSILDEKESYYISLYDSLYPNGYNIQSGGCQSIGGSNACNVYQFDFDGNLIGIYDSMNDAAQKNSMKSHAGISACCSGRRATAGGYYWSKTCEFPVNLTSKKRDKRIAAYKKDGKLVKVFNSINEAAIEICGSDIYRQNIENCLHMKHGQKTAYGYI